MSHDPHSGLHSEKGALAGEHPGRALNPIDHTLEPGWAPMTASGLAQWGPPATKDFLGITPGRESLRELRAIAAALREDNEFDLTRLRGLLKVATT